MVTLLNLADAARNIGTVVEDKGDQELGRFDNLLHYKEFLSELLSCLCFPDKSRLGHDLRRNQNGCIGAKSLLRRG